MKLSADAPYWVGFDLGGTKMLATVFNHRFEPIGRKRKRTKGYEGATAGLKRIKQTIHQAMDEAKIESNQLAGIGVGCPSPIDLEQGVILEAVNLGWENVPLKESLEHEFACPAIVLNDVDAGVYAEHRFGSARGAYCVLGVFPGTGIGGGCVFDGRIVQGRQRSCMEFGHIQVDSDGELCGCGRRGCLETVASRLAISAEVAKAAYRGEAPTVLAKVGTDLAEIRSSVLAEAIKAGDHVVEAIVRRAATRIGIAVANFVHLFGPDMVVLGGGLVEAMPELFVTEVTDAARGRVMKPFAHTFRVVAAKLGDDAAAMGAAAWIERSAAESP